VLSAETTELISKARIKRDQHNPIHRNCSPAKAASAIEDKEPNREHITQVFEQWKQVKIWDSTEKNLATALRYITSTAIDLSLPDTALEKATLAYKKIVEKGLLKGRSMKAVCAIAIYIGSKQSNTAITLREIAHSTKINPRKIDHSYKSIIKHLKMSVQTTSASSYASEIASRLQLSTQNREVVKKILEALDSKRFVGKTPTGIACAAIYISSLLTEERRTQREIAEVARITEATIRARYREFERNLIFSIYM
jgi:transcription initiation factor TFIIB